MLLNKYLMRKQRCIADKTSNHSAKRYMKKAIIILKLNNETPSRATINNKHQASSKIRRRIIAKEKKKRAVY